MAGKVLRHGFMLLAVLRLLLQTNAQAVPTVDCTTNANCPENAICDTAANPKKCKCDTGYAEDPADTAACIIVKAGFCPARKDWKGILGACAPQCQKDSSCPGDQKCCYYGCGLECVVPVIEEPYQRDVPERLVAETQSSDTVHLTWFDPSLGPDQLVTDDRYYTIRYYSYDIGQYEYMNSTDLHGHMTGLRADTEYHFNVRVNDPPYLSEWSEDAKTRTAKVENSAQSVVLSASMVAMSLIVIVIQQFI